MLFYYSKFKDSSVRTILDELLGFLKLFIVLNGVTDFKLATFSIQIHLNVAFDSFNFLSLLHLIGVSELPALSLSLSQMSEQFNQEISLTGKIPSGLFNAMFDFSGCWQKDAANTKTLAFDGVFITLYTVALEKTQMVLCDHVKKAVPSSWDPAALAR